MIRLCIVNLLFFLSFFYIILEQLDEFLRGIKINIDEEHDFFGPNLKKLIGETFVKQLYLKKIKSDNEFDVDTK